MFVFGTGHNCKTIHSPNLNHHKTIFISIELYMRESWNLFHDLSGNCTFKKINFKDNSRFTIKRTWEIWSLEMFLAACTGDFFSNFKKMILKFIFSHPICHIKEVFNPWNDKWLSNLVGGGCCKTLLKSFKQH